MEADIASHYAQALAFGCDDVIWTNEGLYLLNSDAEYSRLLSLFSPYSSEVIVVCCFREVCSYRRSYKKQLEKERLSFSQDKDSYRYVGEDSWLFNYQRKREILLNVFDESIFLSYSPEDMVGAFMSAIGYPIEDIDGLRFNVTEID